MSNKVLNFTIIPTVSYPNAASSKYVFYKENKNKTGIYRWTNLVNGKSYVGSSKSLNKRFYFYFSSSCLKGSLIKK